MSLRADVAAALLLAGIAAFACRLGGYVLMRYVAITPRTQTWLNAIPVALVGALLGPVALKGGVAEWLGLASAAIVMRVSENEAASVVAGMAAVAAARAWLG